MNTQQELEMVRKIADERGELLLRSHTNGNLIVLEDNLIFMSCSLDLDQVIDLKLHEIS